MRLASYVLAALLFSSPLAAKSIVAPMSQWTPSTSGDAGTETFTAPSNQKCVRGNGEGSASWQTTVRGLEPGKAYVLSFRARGQGSGAIISGLESVNRDFPIPAAWTPFSFAFRAPDSSTAPTLRLGHWILKGELSFNDVALRPASVYNRRWGKVELGDGESISKGVYADTHRLSDFGSTIHRTLYKQTANFNTHRWCLTSSSDVVYRYDLPFAMKDAKVVANVGYRAGGTAVVSASRDGRAWTRVGSISELGDIKGSLPASFFPCRAVYIRLHAENADAGLQFYSYSFIADTDYAGPDRTGGSSIIEELTTAPSLAVSWAPRDNGWNVTFANHGPAGLRADLMVRQEKTWKKAATLDMKPGAKVSRDIPIQGSAGRRSFGLRLDSQAGAIYSAQTGVTQTVIGEAGYGSLLKSGAPSVAAWWCEGAWKVGADRPLPTDTSAPKVSISAAKGEYEPAQIVLRATKPGTVLSEAGVSDLTSASGTIPASQISLMEVATVRVENPSDYLGKPGDYPDPLPILKTPLTLPQGQNQAIWALVHIPETAKAGDYTGTITLQTNKGSIAAPIALHVFDFSLPRETHLRSSFGINSYSIETFHHLQSIEDKKAVWDKYLQSFAEHRVTPTWFNPYNVIGVGFEGEGASKRVVLDFTEFDKAVDDYFTKYGFNSFSLTVLGLGGGTFFSRDEGEFGGYKFGTPEYERLFGDYMRQVQAHLEAKEIVDKAYVYWFDEPDTKDYPFVNERMDRIRKYAPKITRLLTEQPEPDLYGHVDLWVGLTPLWTKEVVAQRRAAGEEVWWYICCAPTAPYIGEFIDHPAVEMRLWPWQSWQYGVEGILVWDSTYWTSPAAFPNELQDPWKDPMSYVNGYGTPTGTKAFWGNGDGRYLYPPRRDPNADRTPAIEGPTSSIRWENLRDGMEDYEYFYALQQAVDNLAGKAPDALISQARRLLRVPTSISVSTTEFTFDPRPLLQHRRKVAEMLERLMAVQ